MTIAQSMSYKLRLLICTVVLLALAADSTKAQQSAATISVAQLKSIVASHFAPRKDFKPNDLISRADAQEILSQLQKAGWKVSDQDEILKQLLPSDHIIVRTFATQQGTQFMRKVQGYEMIYDRLHRTAELPGGKALVRDIVKLPNGEIYARQKPQAGNPSLTELLPKQRNGRTPPPTDFDKPTGYIYTVGQLLTRLEASRQQEFGR